MYNNEQQRAIERDDRRHDHQQVESGRPAASGPRFSFEFGNDPTPSKQNHKGTAERRLHRLVFGRAAPKLLPGWQVELVEAIAPALEANRITFAFEDGSPGAALPTAELAGRLRKLCSGYGFTLQQVEETTAEAVQERVVALEQRAREQR